jgi:hypothetical protein
VSRCLTPIGHETARHFGLKEKNLLQRAVAVAVPPADASELESAGVLLVHIMDVLLPALDRA